MSDLMASALCATIVVLTGMAIGWRPDRAVPPAFVSSAFVPTQGVPSVQRAVAEWNPVSALAGSCRDLFGCPNPARLDHVVPAQHPTLVVLAWSVVLIAICAPLAFRLFRRRTSD